jgi:glycosyltransferase involved in cell wall biosynthesis
MRAQKVDVEVLSPLRTRLKYLVVPARIYAKLTGKSVTLDHFPMILRAYAKQIESFVRNRGIDVIFCPSTIPITLVQSDKPIVTWTDAVFHEMPGYYGSTFTGLTSSGIARGKWQEETALRKCRIAAYASNWALDGARQVAEESKLRFLPFGSSLPVKHSLEEIARSATEKRERRRNCCELLFVGVNWERKGGAIAVESARLLNEAGIETRLRVVGSKPPEDVPPFVEALGFVSKTSEEGRRKLLDLFCSSDIFILPTKAEAAGIVFAEASSCGLPCITYATGGVTDYVRHGVNGVCIEPGGSAERFAREIMNMLEKPDEYVAYACRAFEEYRNRMNWERSVRQLVEFCRESMNS